ncbi:hypothetical protein HA402_001706 [Bradysia odoriphaga]|nr:hypothetical protein HA402_001706 [Bradysia odoriphaga]
MIGDTMFTFVLLYSVLFVVQLRSESINIVGKDCKLTDPIYKNTFDLTPLRTTFNYTQVLTKTDYVSFNICGDILPKCNNLTHVAACFSKNGSEHVMGTQSEPTLTDGRIYFNYTGDKCETNPSKKYNLQIIFICDYSNPILEPITSNEYSEDDCSLHVFMRTSHVCLPLPKEIESNNCSVTDDKNHNFNLMALSQYNNRIPIDDNRTFVINVCKSVLYGHNDMCPPGSSICLQNNNESNLSKKFVNYGSTVANPTYENGNLFMHFTSMEKCNETHYISSHINFNCDTSIEIGHPEYLGERGCEHRFVWNTQLACSNSVEPCVAIDTNTGFKFNLTSLSGAEHTVKHDNKTYTFGICNMAKTCKDKNGICEKDDKGQTTSLGMYNDHLKYNQTGSPYLFYVGGDVCVKPSRQWTTKIEFLCGKDGDTGPVMVENTDCEVVIQYKTELVCQKEINCRTYNHSSDSEIDLSSLISTTVNYLAEVNETLKSTEGPPILHYLNVCRPLVPQFGLSCPGGSSACRAVNSSTTPTSELGLGYPDISLTVVKSRVHLKYLRGSACPQDPATQLSSVIQFYCDPAAGRGKPILQENMHDCHYVYEWGTNVMCPSHLLKLTTDKCDVFNDQLNATLNLKQITDNGTVTVKRESKSFDLNICANNRKVETDYAQGTVKVFFDGGRCTPEDPYSVELNFVCREAENRLAPTFTDSCGLVLIRETPLICPLLGITINPTDDSTKPDTTDTDANGEHTVDTKIPAWGAVLLTLTILLVFGGSIYMAANSNRRAKVISLFRRRNVSVQYSRVRSDEEASLLLPQPGSLSDSDDDLLA